uniref:Uncharacterized protein n=1 Tax=Rhizophora mucronata TaxID=61149 RepID=A0A2P2QLK6_RHIMU
MAPIIVVSSAVLSLLVPTLQNIEPTMRAAAKVKKYLTRL